MAAWFGRQLSTLAVREPLGRKALLALVLYVANAIATSYIAPGWGHTLAWLSVALVLPAVAFRDRPVLFGLVLAAGGAWLRVIYLDHPAIADQVAVTRAAAEVAFHGGNPYTVAYSVSDPVGAPFPYGPLALLVGLGERWTEVVAGILSLILLAWGRAVITLGLYASLLVAVTFTAWGANDVTPGLFIALAFVAMAGRHFVTGGIALAVAAAIKPYALAWVPGAVALGGLPALAAFAGFSAVVWSPLLVWGPFTYLDAIERARNIHPVPEDSFNVPELRILAIPAAIAALFGRRWSLAVVSGIAIFVIVLYFDRWASIAYPMALVPIVGLLLEWPDRPDRLRRRVAAI